MKSERIEGRNTISKTRGRIRTVLIAFGLFLVLLLYNLFELQYINYGYYTSKVYDQVTTSSAMKAKRGSIYDSDMNILATDKTIYRIFASPREIKKQSGEKNIDYAALIAQGISRIFNQDYNEVYKKITKTATLDITLKKNASEEEYKSVLSLIEAHSLYDMLLSEAQSSRYYPEGTLAAHTLGFVGSDLQGLYGLEYSYNSILSGKDGYYLYAKDANGNVLPNEYSGIVPPEEGHSIVTTIDSYLQRQLESTIEGLRLDQGVNNRVSAVAMDIKSGAVLAMATSSPFDPNNPYELDSVSAAKLETSGYAPESDEYKAYKRTLMEIMWSNKAVSETYEPGSTFKIITVASALDAGAVSLSDSFSCHGYLAVGGWRIKCHKRTGHGSGFSLGYGLQMSCNPCMMTVAGRLGADKFYDYIEKFGYFEKTDIDLPSEAKTIFHQKENIGTTELATTSFGQRFKVTVIRHLSSICTVANGGVSVTPYLVSKVIDKDGNIISSHEATEGERVISAETAEAISKILEEGVSGDGGAKNAAVTGYKIAGKTGTSEKFDILDENGNSYLRIGSTVAYSIDKEGGVAVIIVVDEPTGAVKYGSVVAAPYVSEFLSSALPYLNYKSSSAPVEIKVPSLIGCELKNAESTLKALALKYEIVGRGSTVLSQTPTAGDILNGESPRVILYTEGADINYTEVPNVVGLTLFEANSRLISCGLNIRLSGVSAQSNTSVVISQAIPPGSVVSRSTIIEIKILNTDFED